MIAFFKNENNKVIDSQKVKSKNEAVEIMNKHNEAVNQMIVEYPKLFIESIEFE